MNAAVSFASKIIHFSTYYAQHFVLRNFGLFLHCCELHTAMAPWHATGYGVHVKVGVSSKAIWVWYAVHCESVVAYSSHTVQTICGRPLYMTGERLVRTAFHLRTRHAHPPLRNNRQQDTQRTACFSVGVW